MLRNYHDRQSMLRAWAAHDVETFHAFTSTVDAILKRPLRGLRVLDLGCGANAPMTVLLHAAGGHVTGVDAYIGYRWGLGLKPSRYANYVREVGIAKAARKIIGEFVFDRTYFAELSRLTHLTLTDDGLDLRSMDIQAPDLPPGEFDIVHSNATWEHIADVRAANRTVANCLRPGGLAYIEIHLFPSLSGGHDLPWIVPGTTVLGDVKPWQHLWDPQWRAPVFLNRLREKDYREAFSDCPGLRVEDWRTEFTEGREFLTPELRERLSDYSEEELTKRSIIVVASKR